MVLQNLLCIEINIYIYIYIYQRTVWRICIMMLGCEGLSCNPPKIAVDKGALLQIQHTIKTRG